MADINAGMLDARITIRIPVITYNAFNESVESWEDLVTVWAKRHDASSAESMRAQEIGAELTARFTVRWSTQIARVDPRFRIVHNDQQFDITGTREVGRHTWVELDAVVRAETGEAFEVTSP